MSESPPPLPCLPPRAPDSHKGHFGQALLVGGARGMTGAISLAGSASLRSGAGRVTLAVPDICLDSVAGHEPSYMTHPLPADAEGRIAGSAQSLLSELAEGKTCVGCGPGLGRTSELADLVRWMYETLPQPVVFDADALFALAALLPELAPPAAPRILTPHPGEFQRLIDNGSAEEYDRLAREFAASRGVVVVLKGHRTLITDGQRAAYNQTGNPGMATGGTGDVLTGIIVALVCQGLSAFEAAQLGCHVHGLAGDLGARELGPVSLIARDLLTYLPAAFGQLASGRQGG